MASLACISSTLKKVGRKSYDDGSSAGLQPGFECDPGYTRFTLDQVDAGGLVLFLKHETLSSEGLGWVGSLRGSVVTAAWLQVMLRTG